MENGKIRADLHNHFQTSRNMSSISLNYIFRIALKRLGDGGMLGITNFDDDRAEQIFDKAFGKAKNDFEGEVVTELDNALYLIGKRGAGIWLVKGQEIPAVLNGKETHVLAIGTPRDVHIPSKRELEETIGEIKKLGGVIVLDHPFHIWGAGHHLKEDASLENKILPEVDALEVHNGEAALYIPRILPFKKANEKAAEYYRSVKERFPHLGTFISSDGHSQLLEIGKSYTLLQGISPITGSYREFSGHLKEEIRANKTYEGSMVPARIAAIWHGINMKLQGNITKDRFK